MNEKDLVERIARLRLQGYPNESMPIAMENARKRIQELGVTDPNRKTEVLDGFARQYQQGWTVLSFAGIRDNPLLWSHYADQYKGFCVGFDYNRLGSVLESFFSTTDISFQESWVNYVVEFPTIIPLDDEEEDDRAFLKLLTTKSKYWNYEREYRYVFAKRENFALEFHEHCIREVILGSEISDGHRDEICRLVVKKYSSAQLLQAKRLPLSFELEFVPLDLKK